MGGLIERLLNFVVAPLTCGLGLGLLFGCDLGQLLLALAPARGQVPDQFGVRDG